jgi:hypothetical protein
MTGKKVSAEQVKVMAVFLAEPKQWFDSNTIERKTEVPASSIRHFLFTFFRLGLLERVEVHRGYRYRLSPTADQQPYLQRLREAAAVI